MTVQCTQAFNLAARLRLGASAWHEAPNLRCAIAVLVRPDYRWPKTVGLGHNRVVRHHNPFSVNADTIVALLCVPVDVLNTDTVGKCAAQSISARKAVEPFLERRIGETSVVTRL